MRAEAEMNRVIEEYADTVRRICYSYLKNYHDTEDIFQNVFLKYLKSDQEFESKEYEKAWIIRVTLNACKDFSKNFFRKNTCAFQEIDEPFYEPEDDLSYVREAVCKLPQKYRDVIYLHYFEGYSQVEIAKLLKKRENTIYTWFNRGKALLRESLGGDFFG